MSKLVSAFIALLVLVAACRSPSRNSGNPLPSPGAAATPAPVVQQQPGVDGPVRARIWFQPADLSTDSARTPLQVLLDNYQNVVTEDVVSAVSTRLSLVTYPELSRVPARTQISSGSEADPRGFATIYPESPLEDRWYALRLAELPPEVAAPVPSYLRQADGSLIARFRTGSQPIVRRVYFCARSADTASVLVAFSEPVVSSNASISEGIAISQDASPRCVYANSEPSPRFDCTGFRMDQPVILSINQTVVSRTGASVGLFSYGRFISPTPTEALTITTTPVSLTMEASGCKVLQVQ